jgi:hypothetical protein
MQPLKLATIQKAHNKKNILRINNFIACILSTGNGKLPN